MNWMFLKAMRSKSVVTSAVMAGALLAAVALAGCASEPRLPDVATPTAVAQNQPATLPGASATATDAPVATDSPAPSATPSPLPSATDAAAQPGQPAVTAPAATVAPSATAPNADDATSTPAPTSPAAPAGAGLAGAEEARLPALLIDHRSIADFERIPDEYIAKAAQLRLLYRGASVGYNIGEGLDCLANNFAERRPYRCDSGLASDQVLFDPKYDRSNWVFEPHSPPPNPNPGWWEKVALFVERVNTLGSDEAYDVVTVTFDYVDLIEGANMDDLFFQAERSGSLPIVADMAAVEAAHPELQIFWWTSNLARAVGTPDSESFNQQMRAYAAANGKVLFDMADIEAHAPDGSACFDNRGQGYPAICPDYTEEREAGHLNALGQQRVVKALWVLMARLAGWEG